MKEKVSVIIPTRNRTQPILDCLKSISVQTLLPDEVVIVDSTEVPELKEKLKAFKNLKIKYFHTTKAGGALQRNLGAKKSSGDIILFSDDDTIWDKDYLKEMVRVFIQYPENIGAVSGRPITRKVGLIRRIINKVFQIFGRVFLLPAVGNGRFQLSGLPTVLPNELDEITKCEFIYGFGVAFKKKVFEEFWWDQTFPRYNWVEDDELAYRVSRKYQNYFTPFAKVLHKILHNKSSRSMKKDNYTAKSKRIEYHHYYFKRNIPQDFKHKLAFWWSVSGIFIFEIIMSARDRDLNGVRGLYAGLKNVLKNEN